MLVRFRQEALEILRYSIMVVQWILVPLVEVRILIPQQNREVKEIGQIDSYWKFGRDGLMLRS